MEKEKLTIHTVTYKDKLVAKLNKEELQEALLDMFGEYEYYRDLYCKSQKTIGIYMGDMIKLKFPHSSTVKND